MRRPDARNFLLDLPFDRQAVTVPARHDSPRRSRATNRLLTTKSLSSFIEGMADVDRPVGVGRTIVQHEQRRAGGSARGADLAVEIAPFGEQARLELRQAAAHWKWSVRQEDGFAIIARRLAVGHLSFFDVVDEEQLARFDLSSDAGPCTACSRGGGASLGRAAAASTLLPERALRGRKPQRTMGEALCASRLQPS